MTKIERIKELIEIINKLDYHYYVLDNPIMADRQYDALYDELVELEKQTGTVLPHSPTIKVGDAVLEGFKKHTHIEKLYSLDKCNNYAELQSWIDGVEKVYQNPHYSVEYKFDGLRVVMTYQNGKFVNAATRGNGYVGEDVTNQILTIKNIPLEIDYKGKLVVEGEVMMCLSVLDEYNKTAVEKLKNARNAAAGALRNLDPKVTSSRNLDVFCYGVIFIENQQFDTQVELYKFLLKNKFPVYEGYKFFSHSQDIINQIDSIDKLKNNLDILIDGVVIKVDDFSVRKKIGYTAKFPKWAVAYKFEAQELTTRLNDIVWQVGRTGKLTPIALIEPIELAGATVSRATLNNFGDIQRKGIKLYSTVFVRRSNEVIPEILKVADYPSDCIDVVMPTVCPTCGIHLIEEGANLFCPNKQGCHSQIVDRLSHFASRNAMNIDGLSIKTIEQICTELKCANFYNLYTLNKNQLFELQGFKQKKVDNLIDSIEKSKNVNFSNFIYSLGILGVGEKTAKDIAKYFENLQQLTMATREQLIQISDIGDIVANNIVSYFNDEQNIKALNKLIDCGINITYNKSQTQTNPYFTNKTIVITGDFENYSRTEITLLLEGFGAKVTGSVSGKTNLVIAGNNAGSKLAKANSLGVQVIDQNQLLEQLK